MPPPRILSIATAVPPRILDRARTVDVARDVFGAKFAHMEPVFANAGIRTRHACLPLEWYRRPHGWAERQALFVELAPVLAVRAATRCLEKAGLAGADVDAVVAVSSSGVCAPSLDALLIGMLGLRPDVQRLPVFGLGCAGGVLGLARAAALAKAMPGARVLLVVVELCTLTFRPNDPSPANMVATALFGDGAAAALLCTEGAGPAVAGWGEHTWPDTGDVMGWRIEDDGFGVLFSRDIPALVAERFGAALDGFLQRPGLARADVGRYLCHPGGAKVVAALESAIGLAPGTLALERAVLAEYGNMSAATLLFVIERAFARPWPRYTVAAALGPGFTAGFLLLE